jgi:hypothetical protein
MFNDSFLSHYLFLGRVAHIGRKEMHIEFWLEKLKERENMEELEVDGNVILRLVLKK